MEHGDPMKPRQRDYRPSGGGSRGKACQRLEEGGDAALELTLGPPGEEPCKKKGNKGTLHFLSLGTPTPTITTTTCPSYNLKVKEEEDGGERKVGASFVPPPLTTAVQISQKRCAPAAVVGWPPIRSYRRNIAGSSGGKLQPVPETRDVTSKRADFEKPVNVQSKGLFVKINMDGVPIGRKVDLKSCESYEMLATAVDELFRCLLSDSSGNETGRPIVGLLDGTGEYTLVYEDHEGDRMLVGDVPWQMFVATAKRLRVLKRCDLSVINLGGRKQENKTAP